MGFAENMQQTAYKAVRDKGKTVSYLPKGDAGGSYDNATLTYVPNAATAVTVQAIISPAKKSFGAGQIQQGDQVFFIAALGLGESVTPTVGDTITVGESAYAVQTVEATYAGELAVAWSIGARAV